MSHGEVIIINMQEGLYWADCHMCGKCRRLDHSVAWYCGPTHDEIGAVSTEYRSDNGEPAIVGGMCVCRQCHDSHYSAAQAVVLHDRGTAAST